MISFEIIWTKERCIEEALKYNTKKGFELGSSSAYVISLRKKWMDDISSHMIKLGNRYNKCIYSYEFPDNYVYVGLTGNISERSRYRKKCKTDAVTIHIKVTQLNPQFIQLTEYIPVDYAVKLEEDYINKYKNDGWNILNRVKTGSIGSVKKWNKEKCQEVALKFNNRSEFGDKYYGAYDCARKSGWLNEICSHMISKIKPRNYWTKERCKEEFLKCKTKKELKLKSPTAYTVVLKNKWIDELSEHMIGRKPNGYWIKEKCIEEALKLKTWSEFQKKSKTAYQIAYKNGWLDEICQYINSKQ
jgi:hypothetical protein